MDNTFSVILAMIKEIQERNQYPSVQLSEKTRLVNDLGFSSLDLAELVAVLEMELGVDPFAQGASLAGVKSLGDLNAIYSVHKESNPSEVTAV